MGTSPLCKSATSWAVAGTDFQHIFAPMLHKAESAASQGNAAEEREKREKKCTWMPGGLQQRQYCTYH